MLATVLMALIASAAPASPPGPSLSSWLCGEWTRVNIPAPGSDQDVLGRARTLIAEKKYGAATTLLTEWIEANEIGRGLLLAEAYMLRGDAYLAREREEDALRDWEEVVKNYPSSEMFATALEREFEVAKRYLNGLKRKVLGLRLDSGVPLAEEIILRINERLPGSRLAEQALMELADYYYRERDLAMAAETYDTFLTNFPKSDLREKAMQRRIYANISRFKGPRYDATPLVDAKIEVRRFAREFPASAERAGMTETLIGRLDQASAATMLDTAKFYLKRADRPSAKLMCVKLLERFPGTEAAARAVEIMDREGFPLPGGSTASPTIPGAGPADRTAPSQPGDGK